MQKVEVYEVLRILWVLLYFLFEVLELFGVKKLCQGYIESVAK